MRMGLFDSGVQYQRLLNVSGGVQRYRMMRYVMVLGIILVTIFLYVSYYTTPMSTVDGRYSSLVVSDNSASQQATNYHPTDNNHFVIPHGNVSAAGATVQEAKEAEFSDNIINNNNNNNNGEASPPSEATKDTSSSSSSSDGISNTRGESEVSVPGGGGSVSGSQGTKPANLDEKKGNLGQSELEKRAKSNVSITIPKVEAPQKQEILSKLPARNITRPPPQATSRNKMTIDVYEPGFSEPTAELCPNNGRDIRLLALIHSAPSHSEARYAIRQTWGHFGTRRDIAIGFLVGTTSNATWETNLQSEQFMYGDIVRSNSYDSYDNLTLKTIAMMEWAATYCDQARFLLKVDDDMFINIPKLMEFTQSHLNDTKHIYGRLAKKWRPIRNKNSKYYVSPLLYAPKNFPDFVTGPSYLLTTDILRELYEASLTHAFLKLEDVYMTGIVSEKVGVKRKHVNEFLNRRIAFNPCAVRKAISIHMVKGKEQFDLWKKLLDVDLKCK